MPYYRHPATWTPERVADAANAARELRAKFDSGPPDDSWAVCCSLCRQEYELQRAAYDALILRADVLIDLSRRRYNDPALARMDKTADEKITFAISDREREQWQYRERERFRTGQYTAVPWDHLEPREPYRYPHCSVTKPGLIAYTKSDEHGVQDRQTAVKPGRYLKEFFPDMTDETIRDWVSECQGITFDLKIATTADDIIRVYRGGPSSCMSHDESSYSSSIHPVSVYGDSDLAIAYYGDIDHASGRAIIWPDKKLHGRIYGGEYTMKALLEREGYTYGSMSGALIRAISDRGSYVMPYVDGIDRADTTIKNGKRWIRLGGNGNIHCNRTDGLAWDVAEDNDDYDEDSWSCDRCGAVQGDDDSSYRHHNGRYTMVICDACHSSLYRACDDCDMETLRANLEAHSGDLVCESCYSARQAAETETETTEAAEVSPF